MSRWDDAEYGHISMKKVDKVKTLADLNSDDDDDSSTVDASKLFLHLVVVIHSDRSFNMSSAIEYELTMYTSPNL